MTNAAPTDLTGKTCLVTGANGGIGTATAEHFAALGARVLTTDLGVSFPGACETTHRSFDMLDPDGLKACCDWIAAEAPDVLFNNAGIGRHGWFEDIAPEEADLVVDVNVKGVINGVYAALPLLKNTDGSRIVNTASTAGIIGSPRLAVYSATKFAVRGLTEALDVELSGLGIRCTSLMPWFIDTPILDMGATEGSNVKMADEIREQGQDVYPVSLAAETAWDAAHGKDVHYMAGKRAKQARFAARFMPGRIKKQIIEGLPERD